MDFLKAKLLGLALTSLAKILTPDMFTGLCTQLLDWIDKLVKDSTNAIDDQIVLPITDTIRHAMNLPHTD